MNRRQGWRRTRIVAGCIDDPAGRALRRVGASCRPNVHGAKPSIGFFRDYKALEGKLSEVGEMYGKGRSVLR